MEEDIVNVCCKDLGTQITASHPELEGHSLESLISPRGDVQKSSGGFLFDYFVKPPVYIDLKFKVEWTELNSKIRCLSEISAITTI